ncbi:LacI family DNA-binding transcriptional regulator [soil metagenome]
MPPTQKELAKLAGVSSGTVSNVISGSTSVSERSRQKVLDAIRVLNYQPNLIARSLKTNRTNTLGIVVPDITIPFFPKIIKGAESAARERGYFLIVLDSESSHIREADMIALLRAQRVEGILLVAAGGEVLSPERIASLTSSSPVVCLDRLPADLDVDSVCVDDCGAAEMAISHLMGMGHREIAIITGPLTLYNEQERLRGYRQALQKGGITFQQSLVWGGSFEQDQVARMCQNGLLRPAGRPSALFATNGVTGLAALRSLYAVGLSTPRDFSFVTFDELTAEDFFKPGISSVIQPTFDMGYRAVEVLLRRLDKETAEAPRERVRLPATLIVRDSSSTAYEPSKFASANGKVRG